MNEEMKRKALEQLLAQQQEQPQMEAQPDKQRFHDLMLKGMEPGSPAMEEAMNIAGGAMGGIAKLGKVAPEIIRRELPRFSNLLKKGSEEVVERTGGLIEKYAPEFIGKSRYKGTMLESAPEIQSARSRLNKSYENPKQDVLETQTIQKMLSEYLKR